MPKERIRDAVGAYDVMVGWRVGDAGDVQLAVGPADGRSVFWRLAGYDEHALRHLGALLAETFPGVLQSHADERARDAAREQRARTLLDMLDTITASPAEVGQREPSSYQGLWSTLDREGINRTIRVLRRARDQAYGRDE